MRDPGMDLRSRLKWIATAILIPVILNVALDAIGAVLPHAP